MKGKLRKARSAYKKRPNLYNLKSYVAGLLKKNIEMKHTYGSINSSASTTCAFNQITSSIVVGTADIANRIGDKYLLKNLVIGMNVGLADTTNIIRAVLFQWNENSTPDSGIFEDTGTAGALGLTMGSFSRDKMNSGVLRVIRDYTFCLGTNKSNIYFSNKFVNLKNCKPVQMYGSSATAGSGTLWLAYVSDSAAVSHPTFQAHWTINYTDA